MIALLSRTHIALCALCLILAALFVYELSAAPAVADIPVLRRQRTDTAASLALAPPLPPGESFAAIDARPVLNPARKPIQPPPPEAAAVVAPPPSDVSLVGIIIDGDRRLALIRTPASPLAISVTIGDRVNGWQVAAIEPDHVVLHLGTTDYSISLNSSRPAESGTPQPSYQPPIPPQPNQIDSKNP